MKKYTVTVPLDITVTLNDDQIDLYEAYESALAIVAKLISNRSEIKFTDVGHYFEISEHARLVS